MEPNKALESERNQKSMVKHLETNIIGKKPKMISVMSKHKKNNSQVSHKLSNSDSQSSIIRAKEHQIGSNGKDENPF